MAYLAGMAVNDWADRDEDAIERPTRPIPAGEISAETALMVGVGLSLGALALASVRDHGRSSLGITVPLLLSVWAYDLKAKQTPAGPWTMALARTLDVLVGAGHLQRSALAPAGVIGAHTLSITLVSREEAEGASRQLAKGALVGVVLTSTAAAGLVARAGRPGGAVGRALQFGSVAVYASVMTRAGIGALRGGDAASAHGSSAPARPLACRCRPRCSPPADVPPRPSRCLPAGSSGAGSDAKVVLAATPLQHDSLELALSARLDESLARLVRRRHRRVPATPGTIASGVPGGRVAVSAAVHWICMRPRQPDHRLERRRRRRHCAAGRARRPGRVRARAAGSPRRALVSAAA